MNSKYQPNKEALLMEENRSNDKEIRKLDVETMAQVYGGNNDQDPATPTCPFCGSPFILRQADGSYYCKTCKLN